MRLLFDLELMTKFRFPRGRKVFGITWSFNDYKGEWNANGFASGIFQPGIGIN